MNLGGRFLERIAQWSDQPAIREPNGRTISFGELSRQIIGFAHLLKDRGFKPGDRAVIQAPTGTVFTVTQVAVSLLGGVSVLCEPGFGDALYFDRLRAAGSKWMLVHPIVLWANRIPGARRLLQRRGIAVPPVLPDTAELRRVVISSSLLARAAAPVGAAPDIEDVAPRSDISVIFTGGTTSAPKGVRLSHEGALQAMFSIATIARDTGSRTFIADNPQQVLFGLTFGHEVLVTRGRIRRRAAAVRRLIESGEAGAYFGAPYVWMEMIEQAGTNRSRLPSSLRAVYLGGAPVTPEFLKELRGWLHPDTKVTAIYGMTEAGPVARASADEKIAWSGDGDFVGWVMPGTDVTMSKSGEIIVKSPGLFSGYVGQPDLRTGEGFPTGDLGRIIDRNGEAGIVLLGRSKDMIIRGGINIYPPTLEDRIRAVTDDAGRRLLREAALIGLWNEAVQDEIVVLCWQPMAGVTVDEARLGRLVRAVTGDDAKPDHMMMVDPIPIKGRLQKVDKTALRELAATRFGLSPAPRGQAPG